MKNWNLDQIGLLEEFKILLLDRRLRLMSIASIAKGGMSKVVVDPRVVFSIALKRSAHQIILAHNHPSQSLIPSSDDIELTKRFSEIGELLDIQVADHLIITEHGFHSIASDCTVKIECEEEPSL
ncbi:MAG: DNA repair protein [Flavobacteriales bacterium]|nr:DNA repair protein [Flavobacteriales bacterium]